MVKVFTARVWNYSETAENPSGNTGIHCIMYITILTINLKINNKIQWIESNRFERLRFIILIMYSNMFAEKLTWRVEGSTRRVICTGRCVRRSHGTHSTEWSIRQASPNVLPNRRASSWNKKKNTFYWIYSFYIVMLQLFMPHSQ